MRVKRRNKKGSFGGHLEELVKHFPHEATVRKPDRPKVDPRVLKEKIDIHTLLFEMAWRLDAQDGDVF